MSAGGRSRMRPVVVLVRACARRTTARPTADAPARPTPARPQAPPVAADPNPPGTVHSGA